jgi:hypothetical protein
MPKLNQVLAIEKGVKSRVTAETSELYKIAQKPALFNGLVKTYRKINDDDPDLPQEKQRVQYTVDALIRRDAALLTELMDTTARRDWTNTVAKADIVIDGKVLVAGVPATYLLFLEKQLLDIRAMAEALPVLDEAETWKEDANSGLRVTDAVSTQRSKKIQRPLVLYNATPEHPAQTQIITEDVLAGFWDTVKMSGAMPKPKKQALVERVETLTKAVKEAREAANMAEVVEPPAVGNALFTYLLES